MAAFECARARIVAGLLVDALAKEVPALVWWRASLWFRRLRTEQEISLQCRVTNAVPDFQKVYPALPFWYVPVCIKRNLLLSPECKTGISLLGQNGAVISGDDFPQKNCFGESMGTSDPHHAATSMHPISMPRILPWKYGRKRGQAVACFVSGDRVFFKTAVSVTMILYTPERACASISRIVFAEGTVDFIFGWSEAVFNRCTIHSLGDGYLTAPSTDKGQKYGYIFYDCSDEVRKERKFICRAHGGLMLRWFYLLQSLGKQIRPEPIGESIQWKDRELCRIQDIGEGAALTHRAAFGRQLEWFERIMI